jgi:multidrug efflux pump
MLAEIPEVASTLIIVGSPQVSNLVIIGRLTDWSVRTRKQQSMVAELSPKLRRIPGVLAFGLNPASLGAAPSSRPIEFVIRTTGTYGDLQEYVEKIFERLDDSPILTNLDTDLKLNKPEFRVEIDRSKVADLGLDVSVVGRTLETLLGSRQVTRFEMNGKQYDVLVQLAVEDRTSPSALSTVFLRGPKGDMIQLSNIVTIKESVAPRELRRFNQMRSATITANIGPGYALGDGLTALEQIAKEVLPKGVETDVTGQSREYRAAGSSMLFIFVLALGFIYLVLSAQFESFRDPVIILLAVPLTMTGALAALYLSGGTLNVYSQIGLVTLVGLITKHGILIVEFANQQQMLGKDRIEAVIESASLRLRPILMTTGAMVLGAVPLALATGAGAESRHQIGWVVVGGMSFGTLLTLFVIPTVYSYLGARHHEAHMATDAAHVQQPAE